MKHPDQFGSPAAALAKALDSYVAWVNCQFGQQPADGDNSGSSLLHAVAEIRRHHCPGATQLMTSLLLGHSRLSTLVFEHQLRLVRGQPSEPLIKSNEFVSLVEKQRATIAAMRTTCVSQRPLCIFTAKSPKEAGIPSAWSPLVGDEPNSLPSDLPQASATMAERIALAARGG